jgi:predicted permease
MSVVAIVLPIFALIAVGFSAARWGLLSVAGRKGLAEFVTTLAIPALLFKTIAGSAELPAAPQRIWLAYYGAAAATWVLATLAAHGVLRRPAADAASIAMTSTYGNTVMLGIPLCLGLYGEAAAAVMAVIIAIHSPLYWVTATLHHQAAIASRAVSASALGLQVARDLGRNPLILAILAAGLWRLTGLGLAAIPDRVLGLLAQAGVPAALVALGTNLVGFSMRGQAPILATLLALKLVVMPGIAAALCWGLGLAPVAAGVVILFAAMPAGANAYLFSEKVQRCTDAASGAVAFGTALSLIVASLLVGWLAAAT